MPPRARLLRLRWIPRRGIYSTKCGVPSDPVLCQNSDSHDIPKRRPTALGDVANTDTKLLICSLFQKSRVLAQDGVRLGAVDGHAQGESCRWGVRVPLDSDFELARRAAAHARQRDDGSFRNVTSWIGSENQTPPAGRIDPYRLRLLDLEAHGGHDPRPEHQSQPTPRAHRSSRIARRMRQRRSIVPSGRERTRTKRTAPTVARILLYSCTSLASTIGNDTFRLVCLFGHDAIGDTRAAF